MARLELVGCRLAIQMNVGYFPNGRARRRTVTLRNVHPDASADQLAMVVRALEKVIAHPIIRVRVVKKYILVADGGEARSAALQTTDKPSGQSYDKNQKGDHHSDIRLRLSAGGAWLLPRIQAVRDGERINLSSWQFAVDFFRDLCIIWNYNPNYTKIGDGKWLTWKEHCNRL
jgi:hypothetical protein